MDFRVLTVYRLDLNKDEFNLIQRALRGALTEEEKAEAQALQEKLLIERHSVLSQMAKTSEVAVTNIEAAHEAAKGKKR